MQLKKYAVLAAMLSMAGLAQANDAPHIVNGTPITPSNYPWFASLSEGPSTTTCGASVINPAWAMSAAHCFPSSIDTVVVGRALFSNTGSGQTIPIKRVIVHPQYDSKTGDNDIALIELTNPVNNVPGVKLAPPVIGGINAAGGVNTPGAMAKSMGRGALAASAGYLRMTLSLSANCGRNMAACISEAQSKGNSDVDIVTTLLLANGLNDPSQGIGYTQLVSLLNGSAGGASSIGALVSGIEAKGVSVLQMAQTITSTANDGSDQVLEVNLPLIDNATCAGSTGLGITDNMLCAGYKGTPQDTCQGDSGGPLVMRNAQNTDWVQVGIVSFGGVCATNYGVYTRVANYIDWIGQYIPEVNYNRVFAWGEAVGAPQLLNAAGNESSTTAYPPYWARIYPASGSALGVSSQDLNLYYYNGGNISNQGPVSGWLSKAQTAGY